MSQHVNDSGKDGRQEFEVGSMGENNNDKITADHGLTKVQSKAIVEAARAWCADGFSVIRTPTCPKDNTFVPKSSGLATGHGCT